MHLEKTWNFFLFNLIWLQNTKPSEIMTPNLIVLDTYLNFPSHFLLNSNKQRPWQRLEAENLSLWFCRFQKLILIFLFPLIPVEVCCLVASPGAPALHPREMLLQLHRKYPVIEKNENCTTCKTFFSAPMMLKSANCTVVIHINASILCI